MIPKPAESLTASIVAAYSAVILAACPIGTGSPGTVAVAPVCTILTVQFESNPKATTVIGFERTDPTLDHGFVRHGLFGPKGNATIGFTRDVYGISEAWLRNPFAPQVHRAQVTPALPRGSGGPSTPPRVADFSGSAWSIQAQDAMGIWSPVFATGSANAGEQETDLAAAGLTVPQLMPVGLANPQMFACAGGRTDDDAERTTLLIESKAPNAATGTRGGATVIQDLLNGDDRYVPPDPRLVPLVGPNSPPPTPAVHGPGNPIRKGSVQCAMTQVDDNLATRELHMLAIDRGVLYHSVASDFGTATTGWGSTFSRFRSVSPWGDVGQVLGGGFGTIVSAAIVASRPSAVSVLFVAESGGRYRLWHAVRFSQGGSWRPADDVFRLSGDAPNGFSVPWQVAAGTCPAWGATASNSQELLVALWGRDNIELIVIRVLSTPQQWRPGVSGIYAPLRSLGYLGNSSVTDRSFTVPGIIVTTRPFRDDAVPPP